MKLSFGGGNNKALDEQFKPCEQFRISLAEVAKTNNTSSNSRLFNQAAPSFAPPMNADYLKNKRGSVFHKAFESGGQMVKDFVPPVYQKPEACMIKLVNLF